MSGAAGADPAVRISSNPLLSQAADSSMTRPETTATAGRTASSSFRTEAIIEITAAIVMSVKGTPGNPRQPSSISWEIVACCSSATSMPPSMYHGYAAAASERTAPNPMSAAGGGSSWGTGGSGATDSWMSSRAAGIGDAVLAIEHRQKPHTTTSLGLTTPHFGHLLSPSTVPHAWQKFMPGEFSKWQASHRSSGHDRKMRSASPLIVDIWPFVSTVDGKAPRCDSHAPSSGDRPASPKRPAAGDYDRER